MKFGGENDFEVAITELTWIEKTTRKLTDNDLSRVGMKYSFPTDFLKEGLKGLTYPRDDLISQSKWFPILYSWIVERQRRSHELFRLQIGYYQTRFRASLVFSLAIVIAIYGTTTLSFLFRLSTLQIVIAVVVPAILALVGLLFQLRSDVHQGKLRLDEYVNQLIQVGQEDIIRYNNKFIDENITAVQYAGSVVLQKLIEAPQLTLIPLGVEEREVEQRPSQTEKLKAKFHVRSAGTKKKEMVPFFFAENPDVEYKRRIEELFGQPQAETQPKDHKNDEVYES